jgi:hypothetical protein
MKLAGVLQALEPEFHRDHGFRYGPRAWRWAHGPAIRLGAVRQVRQYFAAAG